MAELSVLLVDDEPGLRFSVRKYLQTKGFAVVEADSCESGVRVCMNEQPDMAVIDYRLPDGTALELLPRLHDLEPSLPVVVLTGHGSIDLAVEAIQRGASHFLTKPVELSALQIVLERLGKEVRRQRRQRAAETRGRKDDPTPFIGQSPAIRQLEEEARRVLESDSPILIEGETGSGKGVLARWLHAHGTRAAEPMVDLNCAGLRREFLESELFGHQKGAFTGAIANKEGLMELAHRGVLFLDEIGDLDLDIQAKLLKALEEKRIRRLGDVRDRRVDMRLVAATHRDLHARASSGEFRPDLYYRLSALPLRVPALRERRDDIPELARRLLDEVGGAARGLVLSDAAAQQLRAQAWPGNIRELRNVLERALLRARGDSIEVADLSFDRPLAPVPDNDEELTLAEIERRHIERVLKRTAGNVPQAAKQLDIPRSSLYEKLKRHNIDKSVY
ncbi:MAG: sigma-54 dependent transcriptional regulator [Myxococcales bacterium]|nr:sigma-54 dependent transcriptional regulator [Myxococcales bacterium]